MTAMLEDHGSIDDFIKPGEFSFCSRCGDPDTCQRGLGRPMCVRCKIGFFGIKRTPGLDAEEDRERMDGEKGFAMRRELAQERSLTMTRLFWIKQ